MVKTNNRVTHCEQFIKSTDPLQTVLTCFCMCVERRMSHLSDDSGWLVGRVAPAVISPLSLVRRQNYLFLMTNRADRSLMYSSLSCVLQSVMWPLQRLKNQWKTLNVALLWRWIFSWICCIIWFLLTATDLLLGSTQQSVVMIRSNLRQSVINALWLLQNTVILAEFTICWLKYSQIPVFPPVL